MKLGNAPRPEKIQPSDDSDEEFEIDYLDKTKTNEQKKSPAKLYAKIGGLALAVALTGAAVGAKTHSARAANQSAATEVENPIEFVPTITVETPVTPVINVTPEVTPVENVPQPEVVLPAIETPQTAEIPQATEVQQIIEEVELPQPEQSPTLAAQANAAELQALLEAQALAEAQAAAEAQALAEALALAEAQAATEAAAEAQTSPSTWDGPSLNREEKYLKHGPSGGDETYYNLPMDQVIDRMHRLGVEGDYWVRDDGVKMLGPYVMVAANLKVHPRGSVVETSLGPGLVCDTGSFAAKHPYRLDIATSW